MLMGGKKNVVFGLFYLVVTALLGPYMAVTYFGPLQEAEKAHTAAVGELTRAVEAGVEGQIVQAQSDAILSLNRQQAAEAPIDHIKGGPHAHGNLEALLNIVVGVLIGFLVVGPAWKEAISWLFIGGAVLHSGMLYLGTVLGQGWAWAVLNTGLGPLMLLAGLLVAGMASVKGFEARPAALR
jgi:hypothetical protein